MAIMKALDNSDLYTIGWIAALPIERAAATGMLDERHSTPLDFVQHISDMNAYTWGRMGRHNVVIVSLPAGLYRTAAAGNTASNLLSSLPHTRIGLLVGIGGGITRPADGRDIRLGDIVVSQPQGTTGGVIQYDLKKALSDQKQERKDFLSMPPQVLLQALGSLQAEHELEDSIVPKFLSAMPRKSRAGNSTKGKNGYSHQGIENDKLFRSSYTHIGGHDCLGCDSTEEVEREIRDTTDPKIHYGIIASGNTLIKDAATRDKVVEDVGEECICFEMEADGLMNHFPCLVIRGVCDYADSHKNDRWQRYASATAAAYGKELLSYVPVRGLQETQKALDVLNSPSDTITGLDGLKRSSHFNAIEKWLSPPDTSTNLNEALEKRLEGTGSWFLESEAFQEWEKRERPFLWVHGIPGCGKTILSATTIEHLNQTASIEPSPITLDFFFDFSDSDKQSLKKLVRSLIAQLYSRCPDSQAEADRVFSSHNDGNRQPTEKLQFETFSRMLNHVKVANIVIDALDECETRKDLLLWIESLINLKHPGLHLFITSRKEEEIESALQDLVNNESIIPLQEDLVNDDIRAYVHHRLRDDRGFERWSSHPNVRSMIESELMQKANGMFRWVACQLDALQDCLNVDLLEKSLQSLPKTLEETYGRILAGISESHREYALRLLQFLIYSDRPLAIREAVDIMAVDLSRDPCFDPARSMPNPREIVRFCSSLVSLVKRNIQPTISYSYSNYTTTDSWISDDPEDSDDLEESVDLDGPEASDGQQEEVEELQLAHLSVQQYLKSSRIQSSVPTHIIDAGALFQDGLICLAYLSRPGEHQTSEQIRAEFSFAHYSAQLWIDNATATETDKMVEQSIMGFFLSTGQAYKVWSKLWRPDHAKSGSYLVITAAPLYYASFLGLKHTVQLLLELGADVNAQGGQFGNALQAALWKGHTEAVQLLLAAGADANAVGGTYENSLQAVVWSRHKNIVQLLLGAGADVNATGGLYKSALHASAALNHKGIVQLLLAAGADVNIIGVYHGSVLQDTSAYGYKSIVQLLLAADADANTIGGRYRSALMAASVYGKKDIVQLLLTAGADIDAYTALRSGHKDIKQLLLQASDKII
ncbi:hypothetical protein N7517_010719 [Penicillium concentricum]|uniref:Nephrocystin 3-like N-terminal domain-containing protein n=1 Tax=Penicillium concentricum TaxID=293559 RepID=A0A9W9UUQ2_9EURO|nr:uncharacterized protein N7517_010719 [Penicillium concentricum]KAJ5356110.1 hypothetical protein N7517_010719 [Penicillium concentricum]